jgi:DNA polymerase/3'-5' exonuclease PolX
MAYTYEELKKKTVAEMREIAKDIEHEALQGYTQLNKEHLFIALCNALGLDVHQHHHVEGLDKTKIKSQIKELKKKRDAAIEAHDSKALKLTRHEIHKLKRKLREYLV